MPTNDPPLLVSLGLFIIDDNIYPESWNKPTDVNIVGGGVLYAVVGGRIISGKRFGSRVSGIVDKGYDFPSAVENELRSWDSGLVFRENHQRQTTHGVNVYHEDGVRDFFYRTPKRRIEASDILNTNNLVTLETFHLCCAVDRCKEIIETISRERIQLSLDRAMFIFEPFPDICVPENYDALIDMLKIVDVFSPNLIEAAGLMGVAVPKDAEGIAKIAREYFSHTIDSHAIVIRCGELGCFLKTSSYEIMLPPYHTDQLKVVDVTGGGNSFCGAFMAALKLSNDWLIAGISGNIASGCVIEGLGMPKRDEQTEIWNGSDVKSRIQFYIDENKELLTDININSFSWL